MDSFQMGDGASHKKPTVIRERSLIEVVINAMPAPVFYKDSDGKYLGCNHAFEDFVGMKSDELVGKDVFELWEPELAQVYQEADNALFAAGGKQVYEAEVTFADGSKRHVMFHKAAFLAEMDSISGMVGVMLDITESKKLEKSLKKSEELFNLAFRSNPALLALTDPETSLHFDVNDTWLQTLKFTREEAVGKTGFELGIWPDVSERDRLLEHMTAKGFVRDFGATLRAKDGSLIRTSLSCERIETDGRNLVLWAAMDITERIKAQAASEAKSVFLANMSHEFRTPLNAILGFSQMLRMNINENLNNKQLEWIDQINTSGELLLDLVNDVLDLARIESGRIDYTPETFPPREVFRECCEMIKPLADGKNITLSGKPETDRLVHVDRKKLKQAFLNLIENAVKYNHENGHVRFGCKSFGPDKVEIYTDATGFGIPGSDIPFIFEPFHRAREHSNLADGTGVGLAIVKKNIEFMNGSIEVSSHLDQGTRFTILLPAAQQEND